MKKEAKSKKLIEILDIVKLDLDKLQKSNQPHSRFIKENLRMSGVEI